MSVASSHNQKPAQTPDNKNPYHASLRSYITGFVLSLLLTVAAYVSVVNEIVTGQTLVIAIVGLAVAQLLVQLIFFLHLGREEKPRLNLTVFAFMLLVVGIIVIGSLWIMDNLNYNMMPHEMDGHMLDEYTKGGL